MDELEVLRQFKNFIDSVGCMKETVSIPQADALMAYFRNNHVYPRQEKLLTDGVDRLRGCVTMISEIASTISMPTEHVEVIDVRGKVFQQLKSADILVIYHKISLMKSALNDLIRDTTILEYGSSF